jgi:hypothetical protein
MLITLNKLCNVKLQNKMAYHIKEITYMYLLDQKMIFISKTFLIYLFLPN